VSKAKEAIHSSGVTKTEFAAYEEIRESGMTNMFDIQVVKMLSGGVLNYQKIVVIMKNYSELCKFYPGIRRGT